MEDNEKPASATEAAGYIAGVGVGMVRQVGNCATGQFKRRLIGLLLINAGVFFAAAALLPQASFYSYSGPISHFINSRMHWEIPWLVTLASTCISTGALVFFSKARP